MAVTEAVASAQQSAEPEITGPKGNRALIIGLRALVVVVALGLWQVMSGPVIPRFAVSRPTDVASSLGTLLSSQSGWTDIRTTTVEILVGFAIGVLIGTVAGVLLGTFRLAGQVLEPLIAALNAIPKVALAPLFLLFLGVGLWSTAAVAVSGVAFVMFYNLYYGIRTVPSDLEDIVRVMGARRRHIVAYVLLPSLVTPFFAGLKLSGPMAIIGVIVGEYIGSFNGVGHRMFEASSNLVAADVFSAMIVLVVLSLLMNGILNYLDHLVQRLMGTQPR